MEKQRIVPVLLLTGYLGSGKTTLLNRILNNRRGIRFAVIVNDIGEVNIDADLIARGGIVDQTDDSLVPLQNGCICCTLKMDLVNQLSDLVAQQRFDYIVIEASGICEPEPIAQTICSMPSMGPGVNKGGWPRLDCIVTVVDALRLRDEFDRGRALSRPGIDDEDIENLVIQQIEFCNIILLNKISEVTPEEADIIRATIRAIQPRARIIECDYCDVDLDQLLDTRLFDFERTATSATWIHEIERRDDEDDDEHDEDGHHHEHHHEHEHDHEDGHEHHHHHHHDHDEGEAEEYGIGTFVYYTRRPFSLDRFDWICDKHWPSSIIRAKGICYFAENTSMSYLFEQAGRQKNLTEAGLWFATAPEEDREALLAANPDMMRDWDPEVGDRMVKLVIIGRHMDRAAITALLDSALA